MNLTDLKVREHGKVAWWKEGVHAKVNTGIYHLTTDIENFGPTACGIKIENRSHEYSNDSSLKINKQQDKKCRACVAFDRLYSIAQGLQDRLDRIVKMAYGKPTRSHD